jgi:peptidoglycan/xylan/chitin deacetylase (PgdA/CDA1 family)
VYLNKISKNIRHRHVVSKGIRFVKTVKSAALKQVKGTITSVRTDEAVVALTFDDGPDEKYTPLLLKILHKHGARATFFMVGNRAAQFPHILRQVSEDGHAIGNHTWGHRTLHDISRRRRWKQILDCDKALSPYGERLFRPPKGMQTFSSWLDARLTGHKIVAWSVGAYDWLDREPEWIVSKIIKHLKPGSIIVLHDSIYDPIWEGAKDRTSVLKAVDLLLERTRQDYRYLTVPELISRGVPERRAWYM